jgi:hypothetical protein
MWKFEQTMVHIVLVSQSGRAKLSAVVASGTAFLVTFMTATLASALGWL